MVSPYALQGFLHEHFTMKATFNDIPKVEGHLLSAGKNYKFN